MKRIIPIIAIIGLLSVVSSCLKNNIWDEYEKWRSLNMTWYEAMTDTLDANGNPYYKRLSPDWNPGSGVLIHYFNDRRLTEGNLSPLQTSTVDVKYIGRFYNHEAFDSSYTMTDNGDSIYRSVVSDNIEGWQVALNDMRVGDSADVVIPYPLAYGTYGSGSIPPYSNLRFSIKLVDIPAYEIRDPQ